MAHMTVETVRRKVSTITRQASDNESAHAAEDDLYRAVLRAIAKGHPDSAAIAAEALKAARTQLRTVVRVTGSAVHYDPTIERWEFLVGSKVWGDYDTEAEALAAQADFEQQAKEAREQCQACGGTGTHPLSDLRACWACGGSGKDCSGVEVRHG